VSPNVSLRSPHHTGSAVEYAGGTRSARTTWGRDCQASPTPPEACPAHTHAHNFSFTYRLTLVPSLPFYEAAPSQSTSPRLLSTQPTPLHSPSIHKRNRRLHSSSASRSVSFRRPCFPPSLLIFEVISLSYRFLSTRPNTCTLRFHPST